MTGGARHASRTDVGAAGAWRHAVFGAKAPYSLGSALITRRAPDCRLDHVGGCPAYLRYLARRHDKAVAKWLQSERAEAMIFGMMVGRERKPPRRVW